MQPVLSIIMPTYNSEETIELSLRSIARQSYDRDLLEILVIDGGSTDRTRELALEFGCRILENPRVQPEYAKLIGILEARARYAMFLDSDEVLLDSNSLRNKLQVLDSYQEVKNIITAGLISPPEYPSINDYTNRFGEPFSYFMYRLDGGDYVRSLKNRYKVCHEDDLVVIVEFGHNDILPICDGGGHCFDLEFLKRIADTTNPETVPVIFQRMAEESKKLAVIKNDYTLHYSTTSLKTYVKKLNWRIIVNMHHLTGTEGFVNRQKLNPTWFERKKYLFIVYGLSFVGPLADALLLTISRRKLFFLVHFPLAVYTAIYIALQYSLKLCGMTPKLDNYGQ